MFFSLCFAHSLCAVLNLLIVYTSKFHLHILTSLPRVLGSSEKETSLNLPHPRRSLSMTEFVHIFREYLHVTLSKLHNGMFSYKKRRSLLSRAKICIGPFPSKRKLTMAAPKPTLPISAWSQHPSTWTIRVIHPLLPLSFFIVFGYTIPITGSSLMLRNYKRSQLKQMSLNGLAPTFDCIAPKPMAAQ